MRVSTLIGVSLAVTGPAFAVTLPFAGLTSAICSLALGPLNKAGQSQPTVLSQATQYCTSLIRPTLYTASTTTTTATLPGPTTTVSTSTAYSTASPTVYVTTTPTAYTTVSPTSYTTVTVTSTTATGTVTSTAVLQAGTTTVTVFSTPTTTTTTTVLAGVATATTTQTVTVTQTTYQKRGATLSAAATINIPVPTVFSSLIAAEKSAACSCLLVNSLPATSTLYTKTNTVGATVTGSPTPVVATSTSTVTSSVTSTITSSTTSTVTQSVTSTVTATTGVQATVTTTTTLTTYEFTATSTSVYTPAVTSTATAYSTSTTTFTVTVTSTSTQVCPTTPFRGVGDWTNSNWVLSAAKGNSQSSNNPSITVDPNDHSRVTFRVADYPNSVNIRQASAKLCPGLTYTIQFNYQTGDGFASGSSNAAVITFSASNGPDYPTRQAVGGSNPGSGTVGPITYTVSYNQPSYLYLGVDAQTASGGTASGANSPPLQQPGTVVISGLIITSAHA